MASPSEPSRKQGREVSPPLPAEPEEVPPPLPAEPEEVPPPPPVEVKPPPPEEVKPPPPNELEEALTPQPVAVVCAPPLNADEATWSVNLFRDAVMKLRKVAIHLGVPVPTDPLLMIVKDYAFKINILVGDLKRGVLAPYSLDGSGSGSGSGSNSDGGAPPVVTTSA
jgi:hypothetical protein